MYRVRRSIDIDFAHHVRGHDGPCVHIHGHTWKFEVGLASETLDGQGFVVDFHLLIERVLQPCHALLDHGLAVGEGSFADAGGGFTELGRGLVGDRAPGPPMTLAGARVEHPGGLRVVVFPFDPTSERLARWLHDLARDALADGRVRVEFARVYETLRPVESVAEYAP